MAVSCLFFFGGGGFYEPGKKCLNLMTAISLPISLKASNYKVVISKIRLIFFFKTHGFDYS